MPKTSENSLIAMPEERIASRILLIRGQKVMLDADLAELYGVNTKRLNEQVKRNHQRFPDDFMFQLTAKEKDEVVAICDHLRKLKFSPTTPYAFTEHGTLMLANVLKSPKAIQVSLQIIRVFVHLRQLLATNEELRRKVEAMEKKYDKRFRVILDVIKQLIAKEDEPEPERRIGFRTDK